MTNQDRQAALAAEIFALTLLTVASKGGNVRGITEDHRYDMMKRAHEIVRQDDLRPAKTPSTSKMLDITCSAFATATLTWAVAFALSFLGSEQGFLFMGSIALLWSIISFGCLIVCGAIWIKRHVRITII